MKMYLAILVLVLAACQAAEPLSLPIARNTVIATDIAYDVNRFEVIAGQPLRLTLINDGALEHDFSIDSMPNDGVVDMGATEDEMAGHDMSSMAGEPDIHVAAPIEGSGVIEFTPTVPGEYPFYCTVAGHKEAGMVGVLVVQTP